MSLFDMARPLLPSPGMHGRRLLPIIVGLAVPGCQEPLLIPVEVESPPNEVCVTRDDEGGSFRYSCLALSYGRQVDLLFVIDDSASTGPIQARLATAMDTLVTELEGQDLRPDLRVGFIATRASDPACAEGPVAFAPVSSCHQRPDDFIDETCDTLCPLGELSVIPTAQWTNDGPKQRPWIEFGPSGTNLEADVEVRDALRCAAPMGTTGCGYPTMLDTLVDAMRLSFRDSDPAFGFFRPGSGVVIVLVTNAVDCSITSESLGIFDLEGSRALWSDPEALSATPALCWNAGVRCTPEEGPTYETCDPAELNEQGIEVQPDEGVMLSVESYVDAFEELVRRQQQFVPRIEPVLITLAGIPLDSEVPIYARAEDPEFELEFGIGPGCQGPAGPALPPVRLSSFTDSVSFGETYSVCAEDQAPLMRGIAEAIASQVYPTCMFACVGDAEPDVDGLQVDCRIDREFGDEEGRFQELDVPRCEGSTSAPKLPEDQELCWFPKTDEQLATQCRDEGWNLEIELHWEGRTRPPIGSLRPSCTLTDDKSRDCPDLP